MKYMSLARAITIALLSWAVAAIAVWAALVPLAADPDNGALVVAAIAIVAAGTWPLAHHVRMRVHWALWVHYHTRHN